MVFIGLIRMSALGILLVSSSAILVDDLRELHSLILMFNPILCIHQQFCSVLH